MNVQKEQKRRRDEEFDKFVFAQPECAICRKPFVRLSNYPVDGNGRRCHWTCLQHSNPALFVRQRSPICPCGNKAIAWDYNGPVCARCRKIEAGYRLTIWARARGNEPAASTEFYPCCLAFLARDLA